MRDGLTTRRMQATLNSAPDTHRYKGEIDAIIKTTARSYDPGDRPVNSSNLPDGGGGGPEMEKRLVDTVKDDIMQVNEAAWPAMVAVVSHMGNVGLI